MLLAPLVRSAASAHRCGGFVSVRPSCPPTARAPWDHPGARAPQNLEQCDENYEAFVLEPGETVISSGQPERDGALASVRSHSMSLQKKGAESLSESGVEWMTSGAKRQCDRTLRCARARPAEVSARLA